MHKSGRCDGKNDSSMKPQLLDLPFDLEVGKFKCGCGERLSLRDVSLCFAQMWALGMNCNGHAAMGRTPSYL